MMGKDLRKTRINGRDPKKIKEKLKRPQKGKSIIEWSINKRKINKDSEMEPPGVEHVFIHEKELYKS